MHVLIIVSEGGTLVHLEKWQQLNSMSVLFMVVFACDAVEELCDTMRSHRNFCMVNGDELYAATKAMTWGGHWFYVHVYYDSYKAALDEKKFDHTLYCYMEEILSGKRIKSIPHITRSFSSSEKLP